MTICASGTPLGGPRCPLRSGLPAAVAVLLSVSGAAADTPDFSPKPRLLIVSALSDPAETPPLERSIAAQLADLNVSVEFLSEAALPLDPPSRDRTAAALMNEHCADAAVVVYSTEAGIQLRIVQKTEGGTTATDRFVDITRGAPMHEALAVIIRAAVQALIRKATEPPSQAIAAMKPPAKRKVPDVKTDTIARKPQPPRLYGGIGAAVGWAARGMPPWVGMDIVVGGFPTQHLFVYVGYTAFSKLEQHADDVTLTLRRHPIDIGFGGFRRMVRIYFGGSVSIRIDPVTEDIVATSPRMDLAAAGAELALSLHCRLLLGVHIFEPLSLFASLGADVALRNALYEIRTDTGDNLIIDPLPVQPVLKIGLRVDFF